MKRHHLAALFLLIFGGLFAYLRFDTGDTDGAIRTAIIFAILGVLLFFFGRLQPRLRSLGLHLILLIVVGVSTYRDFMDGDMISVILGILIILGIVIAFFQNRPLVKNNIEPWLKPITRIGPVVLFFALVMLLLLLFFLR